MPKWFYLVFIAKWDHSIGKLVYFLVALVCSVGIANCTGMRVWGVGWLVRFFFFERKVGVPFFHFFRGIVLYPRFCLWCLFNCIQQITNFYIPDFWIVQNFWNLFQNVQDGAAWSGKWFCIMRLTTIANSIVTISCCCCCFHDVESTGYGREFWVL